MGSQSNLPFCASTLEAEIARSRSKRTTAPRVQLLSRPRARSMSSSINKYNESLLQQHVRCLDYCRRGGESCRTSGGCTRLQEQRGNKGVRRRFLLFTRNYRAPGACRVYLFRCLTHVLIWHALCPRGPTRLHRSVTRPPQLPTPSKVREDVSPAQHAGKSPAATAAAATCQGPSSAGSWVMAAAGGSGAQLQ